MDTETVESVARPARSFRGMVTLSAPVIAVALIGGILAAAAGTASILRQPAKYESRTIVVLDQPSAIFRGTGDGVIPKLNALRAKYGILARTRLVTAGASKRIGIPEGQIAGALTVTLPGPSLVMVLTTRTRDPERSRKIADAVAQELGALVKREQDAVKVPASDQVILSIAAPAQPGVKVEPTRSRALTVGALTGVLALIALYLIADAVRARRARR